MEKEKIYPRVIFNSFALREIVKKFSEVIENSENLVFRRLSIKRDLETWTYVSFEEYLSELKENFSYSRIVLYHSQLELVISIWPVGTFESTVSISSDSRDRILKLSNFIDLAGVNCLIPKPPKTAKENKKPLLFIGHGGSDQWRDLKDHLQDLHGFKIVAYETGSRAGHTIRDVITEMLEKASFAILVMTSEDKMSDGTFRARQNVIHEIGLFQGKLGFSKAIVLKEDGTEEFSNINGVNQIRYSKGNIKETFGNVLAVLKREFFNEEKI